MLSRRLVQLLQLCTYGSQTSLAGLQWLGRRCRRSSLRLERALRSTSSRFGASFGAGALLTAPAAAGVAAAGSPSPDGGSGGTNGQRPRKALSEFGHPARRATDVFLVLNALIYALNWLSKDVLLLWGCKVNALIAAGQLWRLVTPLFLHSNAFHLLINMHALHTLGPQVEVVSGSKRTSVVYLASGVLASLASFMWSPLPSVGASGAVFGLGAALGVFYWRHRDVLGPASESGLRSLGLAAAINIAYSLVSKRIDNFGHLGGLLGGALLSYLLGPVFVVVKTGEEGGGRGLLQDLPPIRWLAFKAPAGAGGPPLPLRRRRGSIAGEAGSPEGRWKAMWTHADGDVDVDVDSDVGVIRCTGICACRQLLHFSMQRGECGRLEIRVRWHGMAPGYVAAGPP
ncbi:hypothetical protein VOLCADRAFT_105418 [Volvox carteri f. nagariensis]|uniref:Peptidase S54 rhomboid domain-containing protein n=1 Tax=Volvox carteri f. nagariensis TaxID=3068 RepID=D8U0P0_VOLCA|nr:uncharacterized protein VOLCADRAFT_105418 [Volvox carteri f. nagariensis]EFJ46752.1 hypothetical protein VOLCADRAFT_105418 [Volvox carteri f. nagariensis]|eukprot:XP_002952281.1 hypothetical protein VOLCADRAFT_105418 [Volvox carteri f. nagariensis]